ncbi:MAG: thiamine phosphate synthase [Lachnospiraceae bacterium]|nr:thiamine phosphate synthase [Lachnospiraceae bacterium]
MTKENILCVTNRKLSREDFLIRIEKIAKAQPKGIILREKDVSKDEYRILAGRVLEICQTYNTTCILHSFVDIAKELKGTAIHLPFPILRMLSDMDKSKFTILGASCHSIEEAKEAEHLGCTYIIAGHIFETDCKKGLPCRGVDFLEKVCKSVRIPVYAIGGIDAQNMQKIKNTNAAGACVMSGIMTCENPMQYLDKLTI